MRRLLVIAVTFLVGITAAATLIQERWADTAMESGRALYPHRQLLELIAKIPRQPPPAVAWLGDSTLMGYSYPDVVAKARFGPARPNVKLAFAGLDLWALYELLGAVMDLQPRVVVLVANLRVMRLPSSTRGYSDLAQALPLDELPHTLTLPYSFRGMTAPRLLLARLLNTTWGEEAFYVAEGVRRDFQTSPMWQTLGPDERPLSEAERGFRGLAALGRMVDAYDQPIGPNTPLVRFCGAAVRLAVRRGAQVLVVVSAIPTEDLADVGRYDPARVAPRIGALRREVEAAGGQLIDLHAALPKDLFRDGGGHFTEAGHERIAKLIEQQVYASWTASVSNIANRKQDRGLP